MREQERTTPESLSPRALPRRCRCDLGSLMLLALTCAGCSSGARIEGRVADNFGKPLPRVDVTIPNTSYRATTDAAGGYVISFAPGSFKLQFEAVGHSSAALDFELAQAARVPAATVVLTRFPPGEGVYFQGEDDYTSLASGEVHVRTEERDFSWREPLVTETYVVAGEFARVPGGRPLTFVDTLSAQLVLLQVDDAAGVLWREKAWLSSSDKVGVMEETRVSLGAVLSRRIDVPPSGRYAYVAASGLANMFGGGIGSGLGAPNLGVAGSPISGPAFLFEVADREPGSMVALPPGAPRDFVDWGACPWEGCAYGDDWHAPSAISVRERPDRRAPLLFTIPTASSFRAITGFCATTRPGVMRITRDHDDMSGRAERQLREGQVLATYSYAGEGCYRAWLGNGVDTVCARDEETVGRPGYLHWTLVERDSKRGWALLAEVEPE